MSRQDRISFWEVVAAIGKDDQYTDEFIERAYHANTETLAKLPQRKAQRIIDKDGGLKIRPHLQVGAISKLVWTWIFLGLPFYLDQDQDTSDWTQLDISQFAEPSRIAFEESGMSEFLRSHQMPLPAYIYGDAAVMKEKSASPSDDDVNLVTYYDEKIKYASINMLDEQFEINLKGKKPLYTQISAYFRSNNGIEFKLARSLLENGFVKAENDTTRTQIRRIDDKFKKMLCKELGWKFSEGFRCIKRNNSSNVYYVLFKCDAGLMTDMPQSKEELMSCLRAALKIPDENTMSKLLLHGRNKGWLTDTEVNALYNKMSDASQIYKDTNDLRPGYGELSIKNPNW